jgi:hypothetical protein
MEFNFRYWPVNIAPQAAASPFFVYDTQSLSYLEQLNNKFIFAVCVSAFFAIVSFLVSYHESEHAEGARDNGRLFISNVRANYDYILCNKYISMMMAR